MKKLTTEGKSNYDNGSDDNFDVGRCIRLVPLFIDKDVEKYIPHFEESQPL